MGLVPMLAACFQPDFRRECRSNSDCPDDLICRFSNCIAVEDDDPNNDPPPNNDDNNDNNDDEGCQFPFQECPGQDGCFDLMNDVATCGGCNGCDPQPNAVASDCNRGVCIYQCDPGFEDTNNDINTPGFSDGCECELAQRGDEICDGIDNDCDGQIDEEGPTLLSNCAEPANTDEPFCNSAGNCVLSCQDGFEVLPGDDLEADGCLCEIANNGVELCNNIDEDCDGLIDEGPLDPLTCPVLANTLPATCDAGQCQHTCRGGFDDRDGDLAQGQGSNGCEFVCLDLERCNGIDDDCDGQIDNGCDDDNDGYCDANLLTTEDPLPAICPKGAGDCDDQDPERHPDLFDLCGDGIDNNCTQGPDEFCCEPLQERVVDLFGGRFSNVNYRSLSVAHSDNLNFYGLALFDVSGQLEAGVFTSQGNFVGERVGLINNATNTPVAHSIIEEEDAFRFSGTLEGQTDVSTKIISFAGTGGNLRFFELTNAAEGDNGPQTEPHIALPDGRSIYINLRISERVRSIEVFPQGERNSVFTLSETQPVEVIQFVTDTLVHDNTLYVAIEQYILGEDFDDTIHSQIINTYTITQDGLRTQGSFTETFEERTNLEELSVLGLELQPDGQGGLFVASALEDQQSGHKVAFKHLNANLEEEGPTHILYTAPPGEVLLVGGLESFADGNMVVNFTTQLDELDIRSPAYPKLQIITPQGEFIGNTISFENDIVTPTIPSLKPHPNGAALFMVGDNPEDQNPLYRPKMAVVDSGGQLLCLQP